MTREEIGRRLAKLREQLAEMVGVSQASISCWEAGRQRPSRRTLAGLCKTLGMGVEELLALLEGKQ